MKFVITFLFVCTACFAQAQYFPNIQKEIPMHLQGYDSVILSYYLPTNPTNGMWRETAIGGYGMKGGDVFKIDLRFSTDGGRGFANDKPRFKSIMEDKVADLAVCDTIRSICFSSVFNFDHDSLNTRSTNASISDASTSVLFAMKGKKHVNALSYVPGFYQRYTPTADRAQFIETTNKITYAYATPYDRALVQRFAILTASFYCVTMGKIKAHT